MFRIFFFILAVALLSFGLSTVADMDGKLIIQWPGGEIQPTLMQAVLVLSAIVLALMLAWSLFRMVLTSPSSLAQYFRRKKAKKGFDALSDGLIALGSGDLFMAQRMAGQANRVLPNDPVTQMLRAQAASMNGDTAQATRIYEGMISVADTELMGLRGLYLLALEQKEYVAAEQYAARAVKRRGDLQWAVLGLFDLQCKRSAWRKALDSLKIASDHKHVDARSAKRQRAVLLTALALELEDEKSDDALGFANEAVKLAPQLVPAAVVAGRINASKGHMVQAIKVIRKCWKTSPHPDLAVVGAYARPGDSVRDRLARVESLAELTPGHREASMAVALTAIEANDFGKARSALGSLVRGRPTQQVCTLMARIEASDSGNKGLVREWLARAVQAPADPQWVADGVVYDEWAPVSPVTGRVDVFEWIVPDQSIQTGDEKVSLKHMIAGLLAAETLEQNDGLQDHSALPSDDDDVIVDVQVIDEVILETEEEELDIGVEVGSTDEAIEDDVVEASEISEEIAVEKQHVDSVVSVMNTSAEESSGEAVVTKSDVEEKTETPQKQTKKNRRRRRKRTKIYVAPPAPDDPGTDGGDLSGDPEVIPTMRPVRF